MGLVKLVRIKPVGNNVLHNGKLDIHRLVVGMGYKFNDYFSFIAEVTYEHVLEVLIEQVNVNYKHNEAFQIQAVILPVPMGIVNQKHEPNVFNGLEHPALNEFIIPIAWRELAIGIHGKFENVGLHYQLSVTNGFSIYREGESLADATAFRMAKQEGVESFISYPNVTGRLAHKGIDGLTLGASFYTGKSQSDFYDSSPTKVADFSRYGNGRF